MTKEKTETIEPVAKDTKSETQTTEPTSFVGGLSARYNKFVESDPKKGMVPHLDSTKHLPIGSHIQSIDQHGKGSSTSR